jgi:hypothetical protein
MMSADEKQTKGANFLGEERKLSFLDFHDNEQMCNGQ